MTYTTFHYNTSRKERFNSDLNETVERALAQAGYHYFSMEGGSWSGEDSPTAADTFIVFENLPEKDVEKVLRIIEKTAERKAEVLEN